MLLVRSLIIILTLVGEIDAASLQRISVSTDGSKFVRVPSGEFFMPWGFNYDRDFKMRLIEDYWIDEWATVEADFREMKSLGANIVRIHLSVGQFLDAPDKANAKNVAQLKKLVELCETIEVYLDITGLGSYRKEAAPEWYVRAGEHQRWAIQAKFWEVVAEACQQSKAVAWYDLCNEPIVPIEKQKDHQWMTGNLGEFWYCQFIVLDPAGRHRGEIARAWVKQMSAAIRKHDPVALITVGLLPVASSPSEPDVGFDPSALKDLLDLVCVHIYPKPPPFQATLSLVEKFDVGKPLVIEEIFPLDCPPDDLPDFFRASAKYADGWISFYWGQTPTELKPPANVADALMGAWLTIFNDLADEMTSAR